MNHNNIYFFWFLLFFTPWGLLASSHEEEEPAYVGLRKFGGFENYDLDECNHKLASDEYKVSTSANLDNKNNIVFGSLNFIISSNDENYSFLARVSCEDTPFIFESRCASKAPFNQAIKEKFSFKQEIESIYPTVCQHVNSLWGSTESTAPIREWTVREDLSASERALIWDKFIKYQAELQRATTTMKSRIIPHVKDINNYAASLVALSLNLASLGEVQADDSMEVLRKSVCTEAPSAALEALKNCIERKRPQIREAEREMTDAVMSIYKYFWHSEQRLLHFLLSSESQAFWEGIKDDLEDKYGEKYQIGRIFLHLHSRLNICYTCRYALARAGEPQGNLRIKLEEVFQGHVSNSFFFKILASFRVRLSYFINRDRKQRKWLSHTISQDTISEGLLNNDTPPLLLKRETLGAQDEKNSDEEFEAYLKQEKINLQQEEAWRIALYYEAFRSKI